MVFLYAFSTNQASAAVGSQEVEVTFEYGCGISLPGSEAFHVPMKGMITATVPNRVAAGEEFYLTNTSVVVYHPSLNDGNPNDMTITMSGANFKMNAENAEEDLIWTFFDPFQHTAPAFNVEPLPMTITSEGGEDLGPIIAGSDGNVILKAGEVRMDASMEGLDLTLGYECIVPEGEEFIIATVPIDSEAPEITLNGDDLMIVKQGDKYEEPGASAEDNFDGDVSENIEVSGADEVDTSTIGEYIVTYTVSDSVGNEATLERTVNVVEPFGEWYTGQGAPSDELGSNGDLYLDTATGDIYKRAPDKWNKTSSNLKGDDGKQGSEILTGTGAPSTDAGEAGDLYFDTNSGDVYEKTGDGWTEIANLQGPEGPKGEPGSGGSSDDDGGKKSNDGKAKVTTGGDDDGKDTSGKGGKLPKTATSLPTLILIGSLLATAGGVLFFRRRKAIE